MSWGKVWNNHTQLSLIPYPCMGLTWYQHVKHGLVLIMVFAKLWWLPKSIFLKFILKSPNDSNACNTLL